MQFEYKNDLVLSHHLFQQMIGIKTRSFDLGEIKMENVLKSFPVSESPLPFLFVLHAGFEKKKLVHQDYPPSRQMSKSTR